MNQLPPGTYMDSFIECWQEAAVGITQCFYPLVNHPNPSLIMLHVLHLSWQSNNRHTSVMDDYFWHFYHWPASMDVYFSGSFHRYILFSPAERLASALTILFFMPSSRSGLSMKCLMKSFSASRKAERGLKPAILTKGLYRSLVSLVAVPPKSSVMTLLRNLTVSLFKSENSMTLRIESDRDSDTINLPNEKECNH